VKSLDSLFVGSLRSSFHDPSLLRRARTLINLESVLEETLGPIPMLASSVDSR
jgi:hypothetical protein